jgi:signal transduction histidine kinase
MLGLELYMASEERRLRTVEIQQEMLHLARLAAANQQQFIEGVRQLLVVVARAVRNSDSSGCDALLADLLIRYPYYANLGVLDADGNLFCSALPNRDWINLSDQAYFRRAVQTLDFAVGEYQIDRIAHISTVNFGYPILSAAGKVQAVVFVALDLSWLNQLAAQVQMPEGAMVVVTNRRGAILARYPDPEKWTGKSMEKSFVQTLMTQREGTVEIADTDGVRRLLAFASVDTAPEAGLYVSVGIPKQVAFAAASQLLRQRLLVLGIVGLIALAAAWFSADVSILRPVDTLVRTAKRLGAGELTARTGLPHGQGELHQLARAFDEMAVNLKRNLERIQALHEINLAVTSTLDLQAMLKVLVEKIDVILPYFTIRVWLLNSETGELEPVASRNIDEDRWKRELQNYVSIPGRGLSKAVIQNRAPLMVLNVQTDPRTGNPELNRKFGLVSYLGVPLIAKGEVLGVLGFCTREEHPFTDDEVQLLSTLAGQAAIAIYNSQLYEQSKNQAAELQKANKAKDEFLSVMSHELRTPLNVIVGYSGMMKDKMLGEINSEQQIGLENILRRASDLLRMVNEILGVISIDSKKVQVEDLEVDLGGLLDNLRSDYDLPLGKELTLNWHYSSELPAIKTDGEKLRHILQNLINNAIKFTPSGDITISANIRHEASGNRQEGNSSLTPSWVEFKIADTGIGIQKEMIPAIFERFRQIDSSDTRAYGGVGIGLYLVKQYTDLLGGTVEVESEPGKGSIFSVTIPCQLNSKPE